MIRAVLTAGILALLLEAGGPFPLPDERRAAVVRIPAPLPRVYAEGEELTYEVSWTMFRIGTIRLRSAGGRQSLAWIDSYDGLPFVELHSRYWTTMDSTLFSRHSWSMDREDEGWTGLAYARDSLRPLVYVEHLTCDDPDRHPVARTAADTLRLSGREFVDGLAIGYFPRQLIHTLQQAVVPTVLNGALGRTTFAFDGEKTALEIDAVHYPVRVVEVHGTTDAVGVFGMTGDFVGWFSDDEAAVPIKGKLKVLLGNVTVELVSWKRAGWAPPGERE